MTVVSLCCDTQMSSLFHALDQWGRSKKWGLVEKKERSPAIVPTDREPGTSYNVAAVTLLAWKNSMFAIYINTFTRKRLLVY